MRKHFQFTVLFIEAFVSKHKKQLALSFIGGFIVTVILFRIYPFILEIASNRPIRIGIVGRFQGDSLPPAVLDKISFGLTSISASGEASPSLALSWENDEKGLTYIFKLKQNVLWHDGKLFNAKDIDYRLKGLETQVIDDYTLKVILKEPYAPLPVILSRPIIRNDFIGLGLYKVHATQLSGDDLNQIELYPAIKGYPSLKYKFYPTNSEAILAYKLGEIDRLEDLSDPADLVSWKNTKISAANLYDRIVGIFINLRNPIFNDKEIRQAFALGTPSFEEYEKANSPLSPLSWAYSRKIRIYNYDPDASMKILGKSPFASESSELVLSTFPSLLSSAQAVSDAWNKLGLKNRVKVENSIPADYDVMLLVQTIPPDPDQYQYWQSTQEGTNLTHYNNPKIDKFLEDGRKEIDKDKRMKIYADFQRYLVDDVPVIFMYYPKSYTVERK